MTIKRYLIDKVGYLILVGIMELLFVFIMVLFQSKMELITIFLLLINATFVVILTWDYQRKKKFYTEYLTNLERLDQKYLVLETIPEANFLDARLFVDSLYEINKSMNEHIKNYEFQLADFKEYVEMWIHEVKIPLSTLTLMAHNYPEEQSKKMLMQIKRLDEYVEQVLYYMRSEYAEHDYLIKECQLKKIVQSLIIKNKDELLMNQVQVEVHMQDCMVLTDSKWLTFILEQILHNSIKYRQENDAKIIIVTHLEPNGICLTVKDNGIGICKADLPRVFQKSFTGQNGRKGKQSTGIGLYLAKKLCEQLGHQLQIRSVEHEWTEVSLLFNHDSYYQVLK